MENTYWNRCGFLAVLISLLLVQFSFAQTQKDTLTLKLENYRGNIQWEQSFDHHSWTDLPGGNVDSLKLTPKQTTYYRARITEPSCSPIYSDIKVAVVEGSSMTGAKLITGRVNLPAGSTLKLNELTVLSLTDDSKVKADGSFEVLVKDSTQEGLLMLINDKEDVVMLAYFTDDSPEYNLSSESTAMALLILYPLLKPVDISRKKTLMTLYQAHPGYPNLRAKVEQLTQSENDLFSPENTDLAVAMAEILKMADNQDRLRTEATDPVTITSSGSSVTLTNNVVFSYSAGVYSKNGEVPLIKPFQLAGSELDESVILKQILWWLQGPDEVSTTRTIDLKTMGLQPGEYELRLRSGLAFDQSVENTQAAKQNVNEWLSVILGNFSVTDFIENECAKNVFGAFVSTISPLNLAKAGQKGDILKEYIWPVLKNYLEYAFNTQNFNCTRIKPNRLTVKLFNMMNLGVKVYELIGASYILDWSEGPSVLNACQLLDDSYQTSPCFVVKKANEVKQNYLTCEEIPLKVKAVSDKLYYPYREEPVEGKPIHWLALKGNGGFAPDGSINTTVQTDPQGEASVTWQLPTAPSNHLARAMILLNNGTFFSQVDFSTSSYQPTPVTKIVDGNHQTGAIAQSLTKPLVLSVIDPKDGLPMKIERFDIDYQITGGGKLEPDPSTSSPVWAAYIWTLGQEEGGQTVNFNITSKSCDWPIQGNPVVFKATAVDEETMEGTHLVIQDGNNQFRNTAGYLPKNLKVQLLDVENKPLKNIKLQWEMTSGKGKLDAVVTTTDANGYAENKFFVDYANDKHDVKVSVVGREEITAEFNETLRLIPLGSRNSWNYFGEQFWDYKKNGPDIWQSAKLGDNGIICGNSWGWKDEVCYDNLYYDKNQTDFYFNWGIGVPIEDMKHYFDDGDTLKIIPMTNPYDTKNYIKTIKVINDKQIVVQVFSPSWFTSGVDVDGNAIVEFAGWNAYLHYIERGKGIVRAENYVVKNAWDESYRPKSTEVPSLEDCVLNLYSDLKDYTVTDY